MVAPRRFVHLVAVLCAAVAIVDGLAHCAGLDILSASQRLQVFGVCVTAALISFLVATHPKGT